MQYTLKEYENQESGTCGKYLEYYDEESGKQFTNAEYFVFDTICEDFKAIMASTGGFCAEMTTRMIKKMNLPFAESRTSRYLNRHRKIQAYKRQKSLYK